MNWHWRRDSTSFIGNKPALFRPPYGSIPTVKGAYIRIFGNKIINWNVATGDTQATAKIQTIFDNVLNEELF